MSSNDRCHFEAKIYGNFTRIFPKNLRHKMLIHEYLLWSYRGWYFQQFQIQHYIVPDREIPLKAVIRDVSISMDQDLLKETLACRGFITNKKTQLRSKRNEKLLPLYLTELPKNETSYQMNHLEVKVQVSVIKLLCKVPNWQELLFLSNSTRNSSNFSFSV